jgi:homoserine O-acetyltransferase
MSETTPAGSVGLVTPQIARCDTPFTFANGAVLASHELVYETYGELNSAGDNAVLICHALSGSHHAAGFHASDDRRPRMVGPGNRSG